jgi:hypothetical protein
MLSEGVTQNVRMFEKVFSRGVASDGGELIFVVWVRWHAFC